MLFLQDPHTENRHLSILSPLSDAFTTSRYEFLEETTDVTDPLLAVREPKRVPPASTTETGRRVMRRLCDHADLDLGGGFDYLQPHGGRRGLGDELYLENPRLAQDVLRHKDISTTQESYRERKAEQDAGGASRIVED